MPAAVIDCIESSLKIPTRPDLVLDITVSARAVPEFSSMIRCDRESSSIFLARKITVSTEASLSAEQPENAAKYFSP